MSSFSVDISAFCRRAQVNQDIVVRKITFELFSAVISRSPVDSGRFRSNWVVQSGSPSATVDYAKRDPSGAAATAQAAVVTASVRAGDVVYMSNNLPYAQRLEYGYSKQAPGGMVRTSIQHIVAWVNSIRV